VNVPVSTGVVRARVTAYVMASHSPAGHA
jgi:hypothetical protein